MTERGALRARFEVDPREQRVFAHVRTIAALLGAGAAAAMLFGKLPLPVFLVALLALLLSFAWLAQARRLRQAARGRPDALLVHARGFALEETRQSTWLPWADVECVEVDEERLDVVVRRRGAPPLRIEPRYAGVDIYELVRTLDEAHRAVVGAGGVGGHADQKRPSGPARR